MSAETETVLAQVDMLAGVIEAACLAILRARVTGPLADVDTAEVMARLRTAKRLATEGASMLRLNVSLEEARQSEREAEIRAKQVSQ